MTRRRSRARIWKIPSGSRIRASTADGCFTRPGCRSRQPGRSATKPIQTLNADGARSSKKWPRLKDEGYRIVAIDQHSEAVATNQKPTWFPVNSRPRLPVSGARGKVNMLGAVTDDGERFVALTPNRFNAEVAKHFLRAIQHEFGEKLAIVLDNAPYFIAKTLKKQADGSGLRNV